MFSEKHHADYAYFAHMKCAEKELKKFNRENDNAIQFLQFDEKNIKFYIAMSSLENQDERIIYFLLMLNHKIKELPIKVSNDI